MKINERIRALRLKSNLTQAELSQKLMVSPSTVAMYERGEREPNFETLEEIARVFGVSISYLFGENNSPPEEPKLSEGEERLIELFREVPEGKQKLVLQMIRVALENQE